MKKIKTTMTIPWLFYFFQFYRCKHFVKCFSSWSLQFHVSPTDVGVCNIIFTPISKYWSPHPNHKCTLFLDLHCVLSGPAATTYRGVLLIERASQCQPWPLKAIFFIIPLYFTEVGQNLYLNPWNNTVKQQDFTNPWVITSPSILLSQKVITEST